MRTLLLVLLLVAGCGAASQSTRPRPASTRERAPQGEPGVQYGKASWYGHASQTASGERFDPRALTAAHRSLKMGTRVRVTNRKNGKTVVVRITDRGPYGRGRIIDLSKAAAQRLDMIDDGVVAVKVEVLGR